MVAALLFAGCGGARTSEATGSASSEGPAPTAVNLTPVPTASPSLSPTYAPPTPLSSAVITGQVPGPDATIPPKESVIPGLSVESLAAQWEALGLTCTSDIGAFPDSPRLFYELTCQRSDPVGNVGYSATAIYWRTDGVRSLEVSVVELGSGNITDPFAAANLLVPSAALAGGKAASGWAAGRLDDPGCGGHPGYCQARIGPVVVTMAVGVHGSRQMDIEAAAYEP
jgi:hypothetical protein